MYLVADLGRSTLSVLRRFGLGLSVAFVLIASAPPSEAAVNIGGTRVQLPLRSEITVAAARRTVVHRPGGRVVRRTTIVRPGVRPVRPVARPIRPVVRPARWIRPAHYHWRPGGAIAAGVALGFVSAATAAAWAGQSPGPGYCWYYTDASRTQGFWDACP